MSDLERLARVKAANDADLKQAEELLYRVSERMLVEDNAGESNIIDDYRFYAGMLCAARAIIDTFLSEDGQWRQVRDDNRANARLLQAMAEPEPYKNPNCTIDHPGQPCNVACGY